jgi:hypothetical protein
MNNRRGPIPIYTKEEFLAALSDDYEKKSDLAKRLGVGARTVVNYYEKYGVRHKKQSLCLKQRIIKELSKGPCSRKKFAAELGINVRTLLVYIHKYGMQWPKKEPRVTKEMIVAEIVRGFKTHKELAERLNIKPTHFREYLRRYDIESPKNRVVIRGAEQDARKNIARKLRSRGYTYQKIGEHFRVTTGRALQMCKTRKVKQ